MLVISLDLGVGVGHRLDTYECVFIMKDDMENMKLEENSTARRSRLIPDF